MSDRPAVAFIDAHNWESFAEFAGALRQRGIECVLFAGPPTSRMNSVSQRLENRIFSDTHVAISPSPDMVSPAWIDPVDLDRLLGDNIVDIQANEDLGYQLLTNTSPEFPAVNRSKGSHDKTIIYDKWLVTELAKSLGIAVPHSWEGADTEQFPVVVKTRVGFGGFGVVIAYDRPAFDQARRELSAQSALPPFCQEFFPGRKISVGAIARDGEIVLSGAFELGADTTRATGATDSATAIDDPVALDATAQLLGALSYTGIAGLDFVTGDDGVARFIDLNPRVFGFWPCFEDLGANFVDAYLYSIGVDDRPPKPSSPRTDVPCRLLAYEPSPGVTRSEIWEWHRESLEVVKRRKPWIGGKWATATRARLAIAALRGFVRSRRA